MKNPVKVLVACAEYEYGNPAWGHSHEYRNLYESLAHLFEQVTLFDFAALSKQMSSEAVTRRLLAQVANERPDWVVIVPLKDELIPEMVGELRNYALTTGYFFDDMWRAEFARNWAKYLTYITTSDVNGVWKHQDAGCENVIFSPFGYNHHRYDRFDGVEKVNDVTFVGQYHPLRAWVLSRLRRAGIQVAAWGIRWNTTRQLSHEEMVRVFNESRINLNLSNSVSWDIRYLFSSPRAIRNTLQSPKTHEQIKGRHFEICGCGGFQLSYYVEGLERAYEIGEEIAIYNDVDDLARKIKYYLRNQDEREAIAARGYKRSLAQHTMEQRMLGLARACGIIPSCFLHPAATTETLVACPLSAS